MDRTEFAKELEARFPGVTVVWDPPDLFSRDSAETGADEFLVLNAPTDKVFEIREVAWELGDSDSQSPRPFPIILDREETAFFYPPGKEEHHKPAGDLVFWNVNRLDNCELAVYTGYGFSQDAAAVQGTIQINLPGLADWSLDASSLDPISVFWDAMNTYASQENLYTEATVEKLAEAA